MMSSTSRLLCLLGLVSQSLAILTSPPRIVKQPTTEELLFRVRQSGEPDKPFIIECEAEGEPTPKYRWIKNGKPFEYTSYDDRISQQPGRGTLVVSRPRDEDLGQYQCFAENEWGTATSNAVFVRKAELNSFKDADDPPNIQTAQEGKPFKLTCQPPDGWPKPFVYWMLLGNKGELNTINNSRITSDPEGNLWFSNVTRFDESVNRAYVCAAKSEFRNEYKMGNRAYLVVEQTGVAPGSNKHEPVLQYVTRRKEVALRGKKVELYCIFGGTPLPQIVWKKNGSTILSSNRVTQDNYGKTLVLRRAAYDDQGDYTCEVSNGVGSALTHSISLEIQAAPFFTEEPQIQARSEGESAEIRCRADGTPRPMIKWVHNGKPLEDAPPNARRQVTADSIIITDLRKSDTGNYGCNATSSLGYVYKDVYINVQSIPPEIREGPENATHVDGADALLRCRVFGAPRPQVQWVRDGVELTGGRFTVTAEGDLAVRGVTFTDVGRYVCYANNKFGNASAAGSLTVKKRTVITAAPESYEVPAGQAATFRCTAHADDTLPLDIVWLSGDRPLDPNAQPRFRINNDHSLLISDTNELDSGEYTCVARTPVDEARAQATLTVQDKPNAPLLLGIECHERSAKIRWQPQGDNRAPILFFSIQYNTSFTPDSWNTAYNDVQASDTAYSVELSPWANYTFRVTARNKIGSSPASDHSEVCSTQPDVPHKNPDQVEGRGTDPTNMVISWSPMPQIEHNGPGFYYLVSWRRNISGAAWSEQQARDWRRGQYTVLNTPTFQPYRIKVIAVNSKGSSNVAPVEVVGWSGEDSPQQAPGNFSLQQVTSATSALLAWDPVPAESLRGHFKGYKIQTWTEEGGPDELRETLVNSDARSALVTTFVPNSLNSARILAYNGRYNGPASEALAFRTPEGAPGPVRALQAHPLGSSALLLRWEPPLRAHGRLTGYKVYFQKVQGTQTGVLQEKKKEIDAKFDRAKLAGLEPNTKYRVEIRAKTRAGEGAPYFVEQATRAAAPRQPDVPRFELRLLSPQEEGSAQALVRWLPSLEGHAGSHFAACRRPLGASTPPLCTDPVLEEDYTVLAGLEPGQQYEVTLRAYDGDYFSESAPLVLDTTAEGPVVVREPATATAGWFIGVMVALALLLLVLLLVCAARRNRGGKYDVHDRELQHGRSDHPDQAFHEYTTPLDSKSRQSGGSARPDSDTDSMAEYGEGETAGMNEDGSFIGQYGRRRRAPPSSEKDSASQAFATLV